MDPRTAAPSGMTLAERFGPVPHPPRVIPEFAQQISGISTHVIGVFKRQTKKVVYGETTFLGDPGSLAGLTIFLAWITPLAFPARRNALARGTG